MFPLRSFPRALLALVSFLLALTVLPSSASAGDAQSLRPFVAGSLAQIRAERRGHPFILALWSVTCTHCPTELKALAALRRTHPQLDIVVVSTDGPDDATAASELAARFGLAGVPQWIFADAMPERLRFEIDPRWYGELPRTLFHDSRHAVTAVSGLVPPAQLARWVAENAR